ncbi:L-lactate permease [Beijerinckiaceae bacterium RH AL1]|nr:L-lactate permease [Beijerinckiaceae bacterium RH CH11]VVB47958.1 L-lactate permease [Beijerinckiaceae bacterium RH AL8]VVC56112.1 L-lactate permease [Beijerinckiaceae bacterium RH AL1]
MNTAIWSQTYDPFGNAVLSTLVAAIPIVVLLGLIAAGKVQAYIAAIAALIAAFLVATLAFGMPIGMATRASIFGIATGLFPIGWIILNVIFLYRLTVENGSFAVLQSSIAGITPDRRLQLLLVAFCFGAFFEGAAGFGTPVAVTGAILIGLGFSPLAASGLSLIANTAPVAYGALGTPIVVLGTTTGLDPKILGAMVGRQLPFFSLIVPFWVIWAFCGRKSMMQIWPAILVAGVAFAIAQFAVSNYHGPWLVDVVASLVSMGALVLFLKVWQPAEVYASAALGARHNDTSAQTMDSSRAPEVFDTHREHTVMQAWLPWVILCVVVFTWGTETFKKAVDAIYLPQYHVPGLDKLIQKMPPAVPKPTLEAAVFKFNILSMTGTGILVAAIIAGLVIGYNPVQLARAYARTLRLTATSLITIAAMLGLGTLTRYSGLDATLGLAFAHSGAIYPFFAALLGWLGVALTGSDTASNVLFGGLQVVTANKLGLSPILMAASNSSGGVMGKMIDAQSIVVASTATNWYGHEGSILRFVFKHSIALACLVGVLVMLQAYVAPFTSMVIGK